MDELFRETRRALRSLARRPAFTATAVATLALGTGGASTMFSVIDSVLLDPLPYPAPDQLVRVHETNSRSSSRSWAPANYLDVRAAGSAFHHLAAYRSTAWNLLQPGEPERLSVGNVSSNFFDALGVPATIGATFDERIARPGDLREVVLSYDLWARRFGSDPRVVGRRIQLDAERALVVGVMPAGFDFPADTDLWMKALRDVPEFATDIDADHTLERSAWYFSVVGRLREGVSIGTAEAELATVAARIRQVDPESNAETGFRVVPLHDATVASARSTLWMLFGAVGLLLLLASVNVTNLMLVRALGSRRELAVRAALGAGRARLVRHAVWEAGLVAMAGTLAGLALAAGATRLLRAVTALPRAPELSVDAGVWGFAAAVTVAVVLAVGVVPGVLASRLAPSDSLGSRTGSPPVDIHRLGSLLVMTEVALAVVLVFGAGLVLRSLGEMAQVDLGIETEGMASLSFALPGAREMSREEWQAAHSQMLDRVARVPGVQAHGLASAGPLSTGWRAGLRVEGRSFDSNNPPDVGWQVATPGTFETAGIPLLSGRRFDRSDRPDSEPVAIVNERLARRIFADEEPLGRRINTGLDGRGTWVRIVGVVGDVRNQGPAEPPAMQYYRPFTQGGAFAGDRVVLTFRSSRDPDRLVRPVQEAVWSVNPQVPFYRTAIEDGLASAFGAPLRFVLSLLGAFAIVALVLGAVGIYGVMAFAVRRRMPEFGVRLALGARGSQIGRMVLTRSLVLGGAGVAIGSLVAVGLSRLLENHLFEVAPGDPVTLLAVALCLLAVALLASWSPARRASHLPPATVMRAD